MKTKLLLSAILISAASFAQEPIPAFYNFNTSPDGSGGDAYTILTSATPLDESATGANVTWDFSGLTAQEQSLTRIIAPTATDISIFPGSTMLVTTMYGTGEENVTNYYLVTTAQGGYSLTGFQSAGTELNYSTDNGFIGNFPLSYGYTNTDDVAGTFLGMGYEGTFAGTGTSAVDAYGTLTLSATEVNIPVTRLKIVQDVNLSYSGFPVGTVSQTIYSYYGAVPVNGPLFRSITTTINIPLFQINQTTRNLESYSASALGVAPPHKKNTPFIAPNPVANVLHFAGDKTVTDVTITDASGRVVLASKAGNDISVSHLNAGMYYVAIQAGNGIEVQKMVKQ